MPTPNRNNSPKIYKTYRGNARDWAKSGVWVMAKSSNVKKIMYEWLKRILHIEYKNGAKYYYLNVHYQLAEMFFMAPSLGKFRWKFLNPPKHPYKRYA